MRLSKYLSTAGVASRRKAEELINRGMVQVNGEIVMLPQVKVTPADEIKVSGRLIKPPLAETYILMNKPRGILTTMEDTHGRPTVRDYLKGLPQRVYPVGRLDKDVGGVLLFTDNGELAHRLTHPRFQIPKTYRVKTKGIISDSARQKLKEGITLEEGITAPAHIKQLRLNRQSNSSTMELTIRQGWKRQIKRMFRAVGYPVLQLERIRFAFLETGGLPAGSYRHLTAAEVNKLKRAAGMIPSGHRKKEM